MGREGRSGSMREWKSEENLDMDVGKKRLLANLVIISTRSWLDVVK